MHLGLEMALSLSASLSLQNVVEHEERVDYLPFQLLVVPGYPHSEN